MMDKADRDALNNFIMDIDCLTKLSKWTAKPNIFEVLKLKRTEIRHSNVIAWLINPNENHQFGDYVIKNLLKHVLSMRGDENKSLSGVDLITLETMDYSDFLVLRECDNIDVLAFSKQNKIVVCIENKIDSTEHDSQLDRYRNIVQKSYADYTQFYVYMTLDASEASDRENWFALGYKTVCTILKNALKLCPTNDETKLIVNNYVDVLEELTMGDLELKRICDEIYAKHFRAIDLIVENKTDEQLILSDYCRAWVKSLGGDVTLDEERCTKSYIRFTTNKMDSVLPHVEQKSEWGTNNHYFYEIHITPDSDKLSLKLSFSGGNAPDQLKSKMSAIADKYIKRKFKENWKWLVVKKVRIPDVTLNESDVAVKLTAAWHEMFKIEEQITQAF